MQTGVRSFEARLQDLQEVSVRDEHANAPGTIAAAAVPRLELRYEFRRPVLYRLHGLHALHAAAPVRRRRRVHHTSL